MISIKGYCFLFQMMPVLDENPWNVKSLYDLQFFNCPSPFCIYKNSSKQEFVNHGTNHLLLYWNSPSRHKQCFFF